MTVVLDAWAIVALLHGEEPGVRVQELLDTAKPVVNVVNLGEVLYVTSHTEGLSEADETVRDLLPKVTLDAATTERVLQAARIKATHRMSYADAFAAATAVAYDAELWTGDPELLVTDAPWRAIDLHVPRGDEPHETEPTRTD